MGSKRRIGPVGGSRPQRHAAQGRELAELILAALGIQPQVNSHPDQISLVAWTLRAQLVSWLCSEVERLAVTLDVFRSELALETHHNAKTKAHFHQKASLLLTQFTSGIRNLSRSARHWSDLWQVTEQLVKEIDSLRQAFRQALQVPPRRVEPSAASVQKDLETASSVALTFNRRFLKYVEELADLRATADDALRTML